MKIFCDLDGTLIDVVDRHYKVYSETVLEFNGLPLGKDKYWELKRSKVKWDKLLPLSLLSPKIEKLFLKSFIQKIEDPEYLKLDSLMPNAVSTLNALNEIGVCYLVTLRRNRENVLRELDDLDLARHFTEVLTGHSDNDGYDIKIALIRKKLDGEDGVVIGDTEADIVTGKELNLQTIAVTSGIRDETFLKELQPDHIIAGIGEVVGLLRKF